MRRFNRERFATDNPGRAYPVGVVRDDNEAYALLDRHLALLGRPTPRDFVHAARRVLDAAQPLSDDLARHGAAVLAMERVLGTLLQASVLVTYLPPTEPGDVIVFGSKEVLQWLEYICDSVEDMAFIDYPNARWCVILTHDPRMFVSLASPGPSPS